MGGGGGGGGSGGVGVSVRERRELEKGMCASPFSVVTFSHANLHVCGCMPVGGGGGGEEEEEEAENAASTPFQRRQMTATP